MNDMAKNLILWLIIAAVLVTVMNNFSSPNEPQTLNYSDFIQQVKDGKVERVAVDGYVITGKRNDGDSFKTIRPAIQDNGLIGDLVDNHVVVEGKQPEQQSIWTQLLVASFPILVIIAVFMFFMRQMQGGAGGKGGPMSFGKSKARLLSEDQVKLPWLMSQVVTKPRRKLASWSSSCVIQASSSAWAAGFLVAY